MNGFYNKITCASGEEVLIAGLCKKGTGKTNFEKCLMLINLSFSKNDDAYDIDYKLAEALRAIFDADTYVVGASVTVKHIDVLSSGGVIGTPTEPIKSANSDIEYIEHGLFMVSFPEGPGIAAKCEKEIIAQIFQIVKNNKTEKQARTRRIIDFLNKNKVENYLIVNDGSGADNTAYVLCKAGDIYELSADV